MGKKLSRQTVAEFEALYQQMGKKQRVQMLEIAANLISGDGQKATKAAGPASANKQISIE